MAAPPYMARFRSNHGIHVRVLVNDIPMYDRSVLDYCSPTYPATPWFIPGENQVEIELAAAPLNQDMKVIPSHFHVLFFHQGPNIAKDETTLYEEEYPKLLAKLPPEERQLPCAIKSSFTPSGDIPKPIWADVPPGHVPEQGTPELLKAIFDLHHAFARRDLDALVGAISLKLEDQQRYFGPQPWLKESDVKREHAEMMEQPWDLAPFEPERLRFRSCVDGRVAYATLDDGAPAVRARHRLDPNQTWAVKPLLVRQGADWRIYR